MVASTSQGGSVFFNICQACHFVYALVSYVLTLNFLSWLKQISKGATYIYTSIGTESDARTVTLVSCDSICACVSTWWQPQELG